MRSQVYWIIHDGNRYWVLHKILPHSLQTESNDSFTLEIDTGTIQWI